jgi:adiponectin receptor
MFKLFSRLDYLGIALLIVGSNIPWLYYAQFCRPLAYVIYTIAFIVVGIAGTIVTLWSEFDKPKYRTFRGIVFLAMGLTAIVPGLHYTIKYGWSSAMEQASLGWMILMGCFYISGTTLYMLQVPERFFPGKFDIFFQSHQIMHVFVFIAVCVCYHAISLLEYKHTDYVRNGTLCSNNILNITKWL